LRAPHASIAGRWWGAGAVRVTVYAEARPGANLEGVAEAVRECLERLGVQVVSVKVSGKRPGRPPYPFPAEEVRRLLSRGLTIAAAHKLLALEGKICVDKGLGRECMKYETFRLKVRELLAKQEPGSLASRSPNCAH